MISSKINTKVTKTFDPWWRAVVTVCRRMKSICKSLHRLAYWQEGISKQKKNISLAALDRMDFPIPDIVLCYSQMTTEKRLTLHRNVPSQPTVRETDVISLKSFLQESFLRKWTFEKRWDPPRPTLCTVCEHLLNQCSQIESTYRISCFEKLVNVTYVVQCVLVKTCYFLWTSQRWETDQLKESSLLLKQFRIHAVMKQ